MNDKKFDEELEQLLKVFDAIGQEAMQFKKYFKDEANKTLKEAEKLINAGYRST